MSANSAGEIFLINLWNRIQTDSKARKDLLGLDNNSDIILIDSKDKSNSYNLLRETYHNSFIKENEIMTGMRISSSVRGDFLDLINKLLIDAKDYDQIKSIMHFPSNLIAKEHMKGIDSNNKYSFFYKLGKLHPDLKHISDFYMTPNPKKDMDVYDNIIQKYKNIVVICSITKEEFIDIFYFMENGYTHDKANVVLKKGFISKVGTAKTGFYYQYKVVDLQKSLNDSKIVIKIMTTEKGYLYIYFYQNDICVYVLSQRNKKDDFAGNCSFINRKYLNQIGEVQM